LTTGTDITDAAEASTDVIWLVMGGGALKGLAHIGAWKAVQEAGLRVAGIVGTSIGAMVGAALAGGRSVAEMEALARGLKRKDILRLNRRAVWINGIRAESVFRGPPLKDFIRSLLPTHDWAELRIPLVVNVVDLANGETVWLGHGGATDVPLVDSLYASSALPVLFPPLEVNGRYLLDGGIQDMLPLQRAADLGATRIIVIDAGAGPDVDAKAVMRQGMIAMHQRVFVIMAGQKRRDTIRDWKGVPLTFVRPDLATHGGFDFNEIDYFLDEGYRATKEALSGASTHGDG
jgi:NTE family protein